MQEAIIGFEHLHIHCIIGTLEQERLQPQDLYIDLKVRIDVSISVKTDQLNDTVSYVDLADKCIEIAEQKYHLVETYASAVLEALIKNYPVQWAWIRVKKPKALLEAQYAIVEMEKFKQ